MNVLNSVIQDPVFTGYDLARFEFVAYIDGQRFAWPVQGSKVFVNHGYADRGEILKHVPGCNG